MPGARAARFALSLVVPALVGGWWLLRLEDSGSGPLEVDAAYAVEVTADRARVALPFEAGERYLLVVGSLGDAERRYRVRLSAEFTAARPLPARDDGGIGNSQLRPVEPLRRTAFDRGRAAFAAHDVASPARSAGDAAAAQATERTFFIHVTEGPLDDPRHYARVIGRTLAEGRHVRVYLDTQLSPRHLSGGLGEEIVRVLEERVMPVVARNVGAWRDVDGDGRFSVLISPWLGRLQGGRTSLGGFVRGSDFREEFHPPLGCRTDVLYLNANLRPGPHLETLLAHEFTHVVCFSERTRSGRALPAEDDWLNEAIAHAIEHVYGESWSNLDHRIHEFLNDPAQYPLVVPDYYTAGLWRNHGCRGGTFLFLTWCVEQFGADVLRRLPRSPVSGVRNVEAATGHSMDELFRHWCLAVYRSGLTPPGPPLARGGASFASDIDLVGYQSQSADGGLAAVDLRGRLTSYGLAGPRVAGWDINEAPLSLDIRGTAAAYIEITADSGGGLRRIQVEADDGTNLQLTLIPLPANERPIECMAAWSLARDSSAGSYLDRRDGATLAVSISAPEGLAIERIAVETAGGARRAVDCFDAESLLLCRQAEHAAGGDRCETFGLPTTAQPGSALLLKVVGRDANGRRHCVWTDVPAAPRSGPERL
ncbi:MAG: hypothetical protein KY476_15900, partial [Planctomycetes bacterium]|nr:hypothetical protein [Planctomycetota bacterium]